MRKIVVLGCGIVGKYMAIDLCQNSNYKVLAVDVKREVLEELARDYPIQTRMEDLSSEEGVLRAIEDTDLVIGSVPYTVGNTMLERIIRAGKNIVDVSYFMEDPFGLDELARAKGVTAVVDCGVSPGMSNMILGYHMQKMEVSRYECYVGGIPKDKNAPLGYKSPFPVREVLEEYAETGRLVEDGKVLVRPMLASNTRIELDKVGTMACLNSDGLRTLISTTDIPHMLEMTLRYPEHLDQMRTLKDAGFFNETPIQVAGTTVRPIDVSASLLTPLWKYEPGEADITVMRVVISGTEDGATVTYTYDMYDEYDPVSGALSMARTTGYTCTAVAQMVLEGTYSQKGISPPEFVGGAPGCWESVDRYLKDRGVVCTMKRS